ncbi:hypothetical protein BDF14DRAFT_1776239 [Spinellus fusiger]|nr:hypothetical protein BDF14DRAFT_1776239 [Spinellus fusiger]
MQRYLNMIPKRHSIAMMDFFHLCNTKIKIEHDMNIENTFCLAGFDCELIVALPCLCVYVF